MTDRELLLENNAKLKSIQKTLINKILSSSAKITWTLLEDGSYKLEIGA